MNLTIDQIRAVTCGAVSVTEEPDGIHFYRFSPEQMELYRQRSEGFFDKCHATAGVRLRFRTDSENLFLHLHLKPQSGSRNYFAVEIFKYGKCLDVIENFADADLPEDYTAIPLPTGDFSKKLRLGKGEKEITIFLPWNMHTTLKTLSLDDGAKVTSVKSPKKLLAFGDSITQGYDALCPSNRYISKLADALNAEEFNKAIGGEIFWPELANAKESFVPDYITVAYGTNDWSKITYKEFLENCKGFYKNLSRNYPDSKIFAITPIWREDYERLTDFPSFDSVADHIKTVTADLSNVMVIDGFDFVPHRTKYYADLRLHPNDDGFKKYAKNLWKQIKKGI